MNRRKFTVSCLGALTAASMAASGLFPALGQERHQQPKATGNSKTRPIHVAFLLYEGMTALDLIGPAEVLSGPEFSVAYVWRHKQPVYAETRSNQRLAFMPTATFEEVREADIVCVPGTSNPYMQIAQADIVDWVARVGQKARWVTSVCTGSFLLGAAGLLKGYRATTHWTVVDELKFFGAKPTVERVVRDRNRVTGAGVTSGIDFGLSLYALLLGEEAAKAKQLMLEYDPQPPFASGSPASADAELVEAARTGYAEYVSRAAPTSRQLLEQAALRLGVNMGDSQVQLSSQGKA